MEEAVLIYPVKNFYFPEVGFDFDGCLITIKNILNIDELEYEFMSAFGIWIVRGSSEQINKVRNKIADLVEAGLSLQENDIEFNASKD